MSLVVLLRGVNVGGHRTFRPAQLATRLAHLGVTNIGAAGTFVVHRATGRAALRAQIARELPFETEIVICEGREVLHLLEADYFGERQAGADVVRFVGALARAPRLRPALPVQVPARGEWMLRLVTHDKRFVVGEYRRHMKAISQLGRLDAMFGVPVTARNWNTMEAIAAALRSGEAPPRKRPTRSPNRTPRETLP